MDITENTNQDMLRATSLSFGESILRAMQVSSTDENGEPKKMTQQELANKSGIGRSTIAKYNALSNDESMVANPDLATICQLAAALNVSPAFLLMTPTDWSHLAQAAMYFSDAMMDDKFVAMANSMAQSSVANTRTTALVGLNLAVKFKLYKDQVPDPEIASSFATRIAAKNRHTRSGILAMSALPPLGELKKGHIAPLLSLCAIMGAHLQHHDHQDQVK